MENMEVINCELAESSKNDSNSSDQQVLSKEFKQCEKSENQQCRSNDSNDSEILAYLKRLDNKLTIVDEKLKKLDSLESKVGNFESELKKLWLHVHDTKRLADEKIEFVTERTDNLEFSQSSLEERISKLEKENQSTKEDLLYIQSQTMRNNLIFGNIEESAYETNQETERKVRDFIVQKLKIAQNVVDEIKFERVHRMGGKTGPDRTRLIVAKFTLFKDREMVRKQRKNLEGSYYYLHEQFPKSVAAKRKSLMPRLKAEIKKGNKAWISYDTLYVNGKPIREPAK